MELYFEEACEVLLINTGEGILLQKTLEEMGHPQPSTPIQVDNTTCDGILIIKIQLKRPKATGIRFYWVRDRVKR